MTRFKKGDVVRIVTGLPSKKLFGIPIQRYMNYAGQIGTITYANEYEGYYRLDTCDDWMFAYWMLELPISNKCELCNCYNTCNTKNKCDSCNK